MRRVPWICDKALYRQLEVGPALLFDVVAISACAADERRRRLSGEGWIDGERVYVGRYQARGLAVPTSGRNRASRFPDEGATLGCKTPDRSEGDVGFSLHDV